MPDFEKSPTELVDFFQQTMLDFPQAAMRKTFGYPCAYINGHMATGLYADSMFLRLSETDEREFLEMPGAVSFAPMKGRPMKGYVVVPTGLLTSPGPLHGWIKRSLEFVATLPPKEMKALKSRR